MFSISEAWPFAVAVADCLPIERISCTERLAVIRPPLYSICTDGYKVRALAMLFAT